MFFFARQFVSFSHFIKTTFINKKKYFWNYNRDAERKHTSTLINENMAVMGFSHLLSASPLASSDFIDYTDVSRMLEQLCLNPLRCT